MIKKNGKEYLLEEKAKSWVLRRKEGAVELKYKLSKKDFPIRVGGYHGRTKDKNIDGGEGALQ